MPTHTPAEKERIKKKQRRNKIAVEVGCALVVAVFIIIGESRGFFRKILDIEKVEVSPSPEAIDMRLEYFKKLGCPDPVVTEDYAVASLAYGDLPDIRVTVKGPEGPVSAEFVTVFAKLKVDGASASLFPEVDRITEDKNVSLAKLEPLSKRLSEYLIELSPDSSTTGVLESLTDALYDIYIGKSDSSSFIMGAYTVSLTYDTANELLTVNAAPAE